MFRAYVELASQEKPNGCRKREGDGEDQKGTSRRRLAGREKRWEGSGKEAEVPEVCVGRRPNAKGLRHFSSKVCEKVRSKGRTTYNEVADELVAELRHGVADEKNIRRRVYDALNVLMAVGVFTKVKKDIFWRGFPQPPPCRLEALTGEKARLMDLVKKKQNYLRELSNKYKEQKKLIERNADRPLDFSESQGQALQLPCLLIKVPLKVCAKVEMSRDLQDVYFDFKGDCFQIHDDEQLLQLLKDDKVPAGDQQYVMGTPRIDRTVNALLSEEVLPRSPGVASSRHPRQGYPKYWCTQSGYADFAQCFFTPDHQLAQLNIAPQAYQFYASSRPLVAVEQLSLAPWLTRSFVASMPNHAWSLHSGLCTFQ